LDALTRLISPILAYTSDEIWKFMPHTNSSDAENIVFNDMPEKLDLDLSDEFISSWEKIHSLRDDVKKSIEQAVSDKIVKKSLDTKIVLTCTDNDYDFVKSVEDELVAAFIVSDVEVKKGSTDGIEITVEVAQGEKCERCWMHSTTVGQNSEHPTLCHRCASVLE
ncbi:MAG: zinc finger domain-containing protein, partial [Acutalibacteraceae bacterium]